MRESHQQDSDEDIELSYPVVISMKSISPGIREREVSGFSGSLPVSVWTLAGSGGLVVKVLTYGGIVQEILVPDKDGDLVDVVLGFSNALDFEGEHPYFGATVGRIAGRVSNAELKIDGERFPLFGNDPPNHLHGGKESIDRRVWQAEVIPRADDAPSLRLTMISDHGDNGYPGRVELAVIYTVTNDNRLVYKTEARTDRRTPVSLTHHSYFNLAGEASGATDDHEIEILSDAAFCADEQMGLTGECRSVEGQANDARKAKRMGDFVAGLWQEHGDLYWLGESDVIRPVARLRHPGSGRTMEVATDCSCIQFYGGKGLNGELVGKGGVPYTAGAGVCFECEGYPNAFDESGEFGSILVEPGIHQETRTEYRFSNQSNSLIKP